MDATDFQAAGLYDPAAPGAADRLAFLRWLAARGVTIEQMVRADRAHELISLAGDLTLRPGPRLTLLEVARRSGVAPARIEALRLAYGLPPDGADTPAFTDAEAEVFAAAAVGTELFGEPAMLRMARVVGSSLARIAEAAVATYRARLEGPLRESGGSELAFAQAALRAAESTGAVQAMLDGLLRVHLETAIRRFRSARLPESADTARFSVGFVDLVGFTTLARRMTIRELAAVVDRFEEATHDVATARRGRVVKLIGDEVMFVAPDAAAACDIALALVEQFAGDAQVTPRGGLAAGELLVRGGDYYGPVVNLAARLAGIAVPREILVDTEVADGAAGAPFRFEPAGRRMLRGFDEPVRLLSVTRA
jgi:adenylate cyclase